MTRNSESAMIRPLMILSLLTVTTCETAKGVGRDLKKVGNKIEDAAEG